MAWLPRMPHPLEPGERGRTRLAGIERADSIVLDPHRGMSLPYGTGVVLVRDAHRTHRAHVAAAVDALRSATRDLLAQGRS